MDHVRGQHIFTTYLNIKGLVLSFVSRLSLWQWSPRFDPQTAGLHQAIVSIYWVELFVPKSVPDPNLEIRGRGRGWSPKKLFLSLRALVWFENKGGAGPSTGSATDRCISPFMSLLYPPNPKTWMMCEGWPHHRGPRPLLFSNSAVWVLLRLTRIRW